MSDSFADLWSASKPKDQPLSAALSSSPAPNKPYVSSKPDAFALLARSGSASGSGSSTPRYGANLGAAGTGGAYLGSHPGSRPITPSLSNSSTIPSASNAIGRQTTPQPSSTKSRQGADAFSDLFSSSATAAASRNMTLAARSAAEAQRKATAQLGQDSGSTTGSTKSGGASSAWAGLDALAGGLIATPATGQDTKPPAVVVDELDDWGLSDFRSDVTAGLSGSANGVAAVRPKPKTGTSLWDLDDFASGTTSASASTSISSTTNVSAQRDSIRGHRGGRAAHKERVTSPDEEFDFGGREDRVDEARWERKAESAGTTKLLDLFDDDHDATGGPESARGLLHSAGHGHDEDDVLGLLSKPVETIRNHHTPSPEPTRRRPSPTTSSTKPPSPPPHILGQIVEMGFSVQQARAALAQTSTGLDVPAAIESLLNSSAPPAPPSTSTAFRDSSRTETPPPPPRARGAPKGQKERERERLERQRAGAGAGASTGGAGAAAPPSVADIQEQADKLLAQASEIGLSVFSKASAMWGKGKERVVKAYEERSGASSPFGDTTGSRGSGTGRGGPAKGLDGRPKWMQEAVGDEYGEETPQGGFKDDDVVFDAPDDDPIPETRNARPAQVVPPAHREEEVDLFSDAPVAPRTQTQAPATASFPSTRTAPQGRPAPTRQQPSASSSLRSTPAPRPTAPPPPERTLPTASTAALATALKHKTTGTAQFKLGQYAAAADAYGAAIQALPRGHLLLVPLHTNRALARIRCGEYKPAEADCAAALGIVLDDNTANAEDDFGLEAKAAMDGKKLVWSPSALPPSLLPSAAQSAQSAWAHPQGRGVDLADGYVKALRRRAEALEGREKWAAAASDWELLAGCAWAGESVRKDAMRGRGRCKGMGDSNAGTGTSTATTAKSTRPHAPPAAANPKPRPAPASTPPAAPSEAVRALQSQNARAEADDALKHALKDSVDARLVAWRQGREGNIRALLVGLDGVLWDGALEGVRVRGLHELVSAAQVKKGYMRIIGRVHPDKLNSSNSTVEQRMLANGVFGTLNEAWIAFQGTL